MLCEPTKWGDKNYGGFLENDILKKEIYTQSPSNKHKMENKKLLYNSVNYLNSIQFEINIDLLEFLAKKGNSLFYTDVDISESERLQQAITIKIAETYKNIPIYLNTHADWRGRLYTNSFFISYQGSDLSTSLLTLYKGEELTEQGKDYLYIYGANLFNVKIKAKTISKKPLLERIKRVKVITKNLLT
jgi:DNA-directed RNA polymerase